MGKMIECNVGGWYKDDRFSETMLIDEDDFDLVKRYLEKQYLSLHKGPREPDLPDFTQDDLDEWVAEAKKLTSKRRQAQLERKLAQFERLKKELGLDA